MARGPVPKEHRSRAYDSPVLDEVPAAVVVPYELPLDLLPAGEDHWHPATVRWWSRWVESPLAARLPAVDWSELEATAVLHHEFMRADVLPGRVSCGCGWRRSGRPRRTGCG
jgi:hypothetical protein